MDRNLIGFAWKKDGLKAHHCIPYLRGDDTTPIHISCPRCKSLGLGRRKGKYHYKQLQIVRVIWTGENGDDVPVLWTNTFLRPISEDESNPPDLQDPNDSADPAEAGDYDDEHVAMHDVDLDDAARAEAIAIAAPVVAEEEEVHGSI